MSIFSVSEGDFSRFTVVAEPKRVFKSSLAKDNPDNIVLRSKFKKFTSRNFQINNTNIRGYLKRINSSLQLNPDSSSFTVRRQTIDDILTESEVARRFGDSSKDFVLPYLDEFFQKKWMIQDILEPYYGGSSWSYPNYHSINFYALSEVGGGALLYPNITKENGDGRYTSYSGFTISFRVKINHQINAIGTVLHFPNFFSVFLKPSGEIDDFGKIKSYKIRVQLTEKSNNSPVTYSVVDSNFAFESLDVLKVNTWHRVTIRLSNNKASILIDEKNKEFIKTIDFNGLDSGLLSLGSFCTGSSDDHVLENHRIFFNKRASLTRGIEEFTGIDDSNQNDEQPGGDSPFFSFTNPLYAEIHDFSIHKGYLIDSDVNASAKTTFWTDDCIFYLGPHFSETSGIRRNKYKIGSDKHTDNQTGILKRPVLGTLNGVPPLHNLVNGSTFEPFNAWLSFGAGCNLINIENFFSDIANTFKGSEIPNDFARPRVFINESSVDYTTNEVNTSNSNELLLKDNRIKLRNLFILPCDDGGFRPDFTFLKVKKGIDPDITLNFEYKKDPLSGVGKNLKKQRLIKDYGISPLIPAFDNNIKGEQSQIYEGFEIVGSLLITYNQLYDYYKNLDRRLSPRPLSDITGDNSSNQIVIFDISNLFYGKFIKPGTFIIKDPQLAGSSDDNPIGITIKDDGMGGLYRADSLGEHARWNTVGRIFYNEGLVLIKNPHLFFFGKSGFEVSFSGEQNIHTLKIEVVAPQNALNLSSNDPDQKLLPSNDPSDKKTGFVYITGLNFHDKNYNVVAKTQLAQPIVKRHEDKIMFRVQMDF
jgi:hypothetical protein